MFLIRRPPQMVRMTLSRTVPVGNAIIDARIARYLEDSEFALAWHLASLAEDKGITLSVPAAVLKALAASLCITGPFDATSAFVGEALAGALDASRNFQRNMC